MVLSTFDLICLKQLFKELQFGDGFQTTFICATKLFFVLAQIPSLMKGPNIYMEIDCYFIREKIVS